MKLINSFKYLKEQCIKLTTDKRFMYLADLLFTGLSIGTALFLLRLNNVFAQGIGVAVIFAVGQEYVIWLTDLVKEIKKTKSK